MALRKPTAKKQPVKSSDSSPTFQTDKTDTTDRTDEATTGIAIRSASTSTQFPRISSIASTASSTATATFTNPPPTNPSKNEYEVQSIINMCATPAGRFYRLLWKGYSDKEATWEPEGNLTDCWGLLDEFRALRKRESEEREYVERARGKGRGNGKRWRKTPGGVKKGKAKKDEEADDGEWKEGEEEEEEEQILTRKSRRLAEKEGLFEE